VIPGTVNLKYIKSRHGRSFFYARTHAQASGCDGHAPFALTKKEIYRRRDYPPEADDP